MSLITLFWTYLYPSSPCHTLTITPSPLMSLLLFIYLNSVNTYHPFPSPYPIFLLFFFSASIPLVIILFLASLIHTSSCHRFTDGDDDSEVTSAGMVVMVVVTVMMVVVIVTLW